MVSRKALRWLSGAAALSLPVAFAQRTAGLQGAVANNTLWLFGGRDILPNGSASSPVNNLSAFDLKASFWAWTNDARTSLGPQHDVPGVAYGTLWSNNIDRLWLFNGESIWRFETKTQTWKALERTGLGANATTRVGGTGLTSSSTARGYYLGGHSLPDTDAGVDSPLTYHHDLVIFDMATETLRSVRVPEWVPVIAPALVYLDAGRAGLLVVIGGKTENHGLLAYESLQQVYMYDLYSKKWSTQLATDTNGRTSNVYGAYDVYDPGIPNDRYNMCAVVGTTPDHSSFNIYLFGGQNDTATPGDVWALTMPGAMWIRMKTTDISNNPKAGSTCNLIHDRYVFMVDGCWTEGEQKCLSYGWNPLIYDITADSSTQDADWNWFYDPTVAGYNVPGQISEVLGSSGSPQSWGNSSLRSPKFVALNDNIQHAFDDPEESIVDHWVLSLKICLPLLFATPLVFLGANLVNRNTHKAFRRQGLHDWRPVSLQTPFLVFLVATTTALIHVIAALWQISHQETVDTTAWTSGDFATGIWTGDSLNSTFTPAAGYGRRIRGLIDFYLDIGASGQWSRHNTLQRLGSSRYIGWTYVPSIVFVLYGVLWQVVDGEVKRLEKYRQLGETGPSCSARQSISLNYHLFWSPLSILQALRYRQWSVAFSSTGLVLSGIIAPNVQNYVLTWNIYSGTALIWGGQCNRQVAYADQFWSKILLGILFANLACAVGLLFTLRHSPTNLTRDPRGLFNALVLTTNQPSSSPGLKRLFESDGYAVCDKFKRCRLQIRTLGPENHHRPYLDSGHEDIGLPYIFLKELKLYKKTKRLRSQLKSAWTKLLSERNLLLLWNIILTVTLALTAYVLKQMSTPEQDLLQNFHLPWSSNVYLVSFYQVFEKRVRDVTVPYALAFDAPQPAKALFEDWDNTWPVLDVVQAFLHRRWFLGLTFLGTVLTYGYTIMLGSLQVSASFYGATTYHADKDGVMAVLALNSYLLLLSLCATVGHFWRWTVYCEKNRAAKAWDREVGTLATNLALVLWVEDELKKEARDAWDAAADGITFKKLNNPEKS
ncbi:hypothetical protein diail_7184 [Diaporthe ilicicola]|nr:hypothetical protein diail_7184 [Diaporthe ilicicola]